MSVNKQGPLFKEMHEYDWMNQIGLNLERQDENNRITGESGKLGARYA